MLKFIVILSTFLFCYSVYCERTKEKIYVEIKSGGRSPCFRRLNGTHQIGCTSEPKGNVGVVHYVKNSTDLEWLLEKGPHGPYAVLLSPRDFNMLTVRKLLNSGNVNGIMVIQVPNREDKYPPAEAFSPDQSCPNQEYGLYKGNKDYGDCSKYNWNSVGEGLMFQDLGIPIFVLKEESDVDFIIEKCYKKFNEPEGGVARDYPLCAVQLKDRMDGAKDSETCTRRTNYQMNLNPDRYCDPMGDNNVFSTVKDITQDETRQTKSVVVVAARMDSFSMFEDQYPSADNHVSGIVALLAIAEAIGKVKDKIRNSNTSKDILFTFFQGEAFDYIGSGRMVYDMQHNEFPPAASASKYIQKINLNHISHFVEVNQLAYKDEGKVWIHTDPISRPKIPEVEYMVKGLKEMDPTLIDEAGRDQPLPPASAQTFLKETQIPAVVITDHKKEYTNKFYNSRLDLASEIKAGCKDNKNLTDCYDTVSEQATNLTRVADLLAKFLYTLATGDNSTDDVKVNVDTVNHLLFCYLISPKCELFKQSLKSETAEQLADEPYQFYVGVNTQLNNYTALTNKMLLVYLGDRYENSTTEKSCEGNKDTIYSYRWIQGPLHENNTRSPYCIRGTANLSLAVSKAFEIDGYDFTSRKFSTWTESSWQNDAMNVRVFLIPSKKFEVVTLVVGLLILVISLIGGYFFNKRSSLLFDSNGYDSQPPVSL